MRVDAATAWRTIASNPQHSLEPSRFQNDVVEIFHTPKFKLEKNQKYFCIGSCFARNVEEQLIYRDIAVLSKRIVCPKEEWPRRPNGLTNKFTTASMANEFDWVLGGPIPEKTFVETEQGWLDLQLAPGHAPVSKARAISRREYLTEQYFSRVESADVLVVTLGYIESWYDNETGLYLNATPSKWMVGRNKGRFEFECTDFNHNLENLNRIHEHFTAKDRTKKIIVTVSPVPLGTTFSGKDILVANLHSKALLRTAAQSFANAHENVDYFPSYEMIAESRRDVVFSNYDFIHVQNSQVSRVTARFLEAYISDVGLTDPDFVELLYLEANQDVYEAVRAGSFESGYEHWIKHGRREGRKIAPDITPDWAKGG